MARLTGHYRHFKTECVKKILTKDKYTSEKVNSIAVIEYSLRTRT